MQIKECDNKQNCHDAIVIGDDSNALRVVCRHCKHQYIIRKDSRGIADNRQYSKIFKKDILQGKDNLFYKYHDECLLK
jgi:hypothetical protein